jgi:hypothetical protein
VCSDWLILRKWPCRKNRNTANGLNARKDQYESNCQEHDGDNSGNYYSHILKN